MAYYNSIYVSSIFKVTTIPTGIITDLYQFVFSFNEIFAGGSRGMTLSTHNNSIYVSSILKVVAVPTKSMVQFEPPMVDGYRLPYAYYACLYKFCESNF